MSFAVSIGRRSPLQADAAPDLDRGDPNAGGPSPSEPHASVIASDTSDQDMFAQALALAAEPIVLDGTDKPPIPEPPSPEPPVPVVIAAAPPVERRPDWEALALMPQMLSVMEKFATRPADPPAAPPVFHVHMPTVEGAVVNVPEQIAPVVHVAAQEAPAVHVHVPEHPPQAAPVVNIQAAEQPAPVVNVTVPAPEVQVQIPEPQPRSVRVEYDEHGTKRYVTE